MKRFLLSTLLTMVIVLTTSAPALAAKQEAEKNIAIVNGKAIPQSFADALVAAQVAQGRPDSEQLRSAVKEDLVGRELIAQEAQRAGFGKKSEVKAQMEVARQSVLINAYLQDFVRSHPITEEALRKAYETIKAQLGNKEYKARHILVEKEDEAKDIIARLKKGEKFEDLAKQSKDTGSKDRGGDLGWAAPGNYVLPFAEAMSKLEKGKYTETPVKSNFGYHVIKLDDTRELKVPSFDEVRPQLTQRLQKQLVDRHIAELRGKAKVE